MNSDFSSDEDIGPPDEGLVDPYLLEWSKRQHHVFVDVTFEITLGENERKKVRRKKKKSRIKERKKKKPLHSVRPVNQQYERHRPRKRASSSGNSSARYYFPQEHLFMNSEEFLYSKNNEKTTLSFHDFYTPSVWTP